MRTKGKGNRRFAIVLAMMMALQSMAFSTSVFAAEEDTLDQPARPEVTSYEENNMIEESNAAAEADIESEAAAAEAEEEAAPAEEEQRQ